MSKHPNPLDTSTPLHRTTAEHLATSEEAENLTTPEAELEFAELTEEEQEDDSQHTSQSTLGGATFHTTHRNGHMGDGDESQDWQIQQTEKSSG